MIEAAESRQPAQTISKPLSKNFHERPIVLALFLWWFQYVPGRTWQMIWQIVIKIYDFFSITLLFSTLTQPWKRDETDSSNMPLDVKIRVWMMNLISIFIGFTVRSITIFIGFGAISTVFILGISFIIVFYLLPIFSILMIYLGAVT